MPGKDVITRQPVWGTAQVRDPQGSGFTRKISKQSLADQVARTLRDMILTGEVNPDRQITQSWVAQLLDVSTMPVREALLRLDGEGFLIAAPSRSFTVRRITEDDIRDIYWMHAVLAGELTRRACVRCDESLMETLRAIEAEFVVAWRRGDRGEMDAANWRFHREINRAAEAPKLWLLLHATLRYIPSGFYALVPAWADESERGHSAILQAFESGKPELARSEAETHARAAGELLISSFWASDRWSTDGWSANGVGT